MQQIVLIARRAMEPLGAMGIAIGSVINVFLVEEWEGVEELQHLLELQLAAIRVGSLMGIVMILTTILNAPTMVEIVVDLMSTLNTAMYVNASLAMVNIIINIFEYCLT